MAGWLPGWLAPNNASWTPTVALQHRTSVVFVSGVLRSHVSPTKLGVCSPSFVPFLSCVSCPCIGRFSAFSRLPLRRFRSVCSRVCSRGPGCTVTRCTLRCASPAHPRAFPQSTSQLPSLWGSPRAGWRIRRVSRGMQPRLCLQPAPQQLAARPLHSLSPPRRPSDSPPSGAFCSLAPQWIATRASNPARAALSPPT